MDYYGYRAILDSVVKAKEGSFLSIEKAISKALSDTSGFVTTGDGMVWALNRKGLNKMVAAQNKDGPKAYQRERILAIQQIVELAHSAKKPVISKDDGRDQMVEAIYSYFAEFSSGGATLRVRILCKKYREQKKTLKDKMHSIAMDGVPATLGVADGVLFGLEFVLLDVTPRATQSTLALPSAMSKTNIAHANAKANSQHVVRR